jgi:hypothetical protein
MKPTDKRDANQLGAQAAASTSDLSTLRLPQDFEARIGVEKLLVQVPVRRPDKQSFNRVRPGSEWRADIAAIVLKGQSTEVYAVSPDLAPSLPRDVTRLRLVTAITRDGRLFLWRLRHPNSAGDMWAYSDLAAADAAERDWVRVTAVNGAFDIYRATGVLPEPEWPKQSFEEIFRLAFRDRVIESVDHPVLRQLEGAL